MLDIIAENAAKLCGADDAVIRRVEGEGLRAAAHFGSIRMATGLGQLEPIERGGFAGRAVQEGRTLHVHDLMAVEAEFPGARERGIALGVRTALAVPLLREGSPIGLIHIRRLKVQPFTERQIKLVETFADQAVIAIENVRLFQELEARNRDLTEALEQQTATSEILRVIASSPTDIQPVLNTVAESAARLCGASDANVRLCEGAMLRSVAQHGQLPFDAVLPVNRGTAAGRAVVDRQTIHIEDFAARSEDEFPEGKDVQRRFGFRTVLATPMLRQNVAIGVIVIRRMELRPFTEKQIKLLETFADQAVIAIENVRLFQELGERNAELREALEHQTATAEVLGIISRSPTDVQPVLDAIVESAARVCAIDDLVLRLREGDVLSARAHFGPIPIPTSRVEMSIDDPRFRWMRERGTLHIPDRREQNLIPTLGSVSDWRGWLGVPLRQQGELIGILAARRTEVRPFTPAQIKLLETFADQAVIAIENVRLFQELKESLEQQTATSEILGVIASSPTDIQPVLDVVAENAARLCGATDAVIYRVDGEVIYPVAVFGSMPPAPKGTSINRRTPLCRAIVDRQTVHVADLLAEVDNDFPDSKAIQQVTGTRTSLATPLLREGISIGAIHVRRSEVRPFTEKQIALLKTFADQAVIAIENVRLFQELQERTRELVKSVEELKALGEVGQAVSSTLDLQTVLSTIVRHAVQLSGTDCGIIYEYDEPTREFHLRASYQMEQELVDAYKATPLRIGQGATGRAAETKIPYTDCRPSRRAGVRHQRPASDFISPRLSIAPRCTAASRSESRGGFDNLPA